MPKDCTRYQRAYSRILPYDYSSESLAPKVRPEKEIRTKNATSFILYAIQHRVEKSYRLCNEIVLIAMERLPVNLRAEYYSSRKNDKSVTIRADNFGLSTRVKIDARLEPKPSNGLPYDLFSWNKIKDSR